MRQRKNHGEEGQVMVLLALVLTALLIAAGFAIDGGFGLLQSRQAQNAADFASLAIAPLMPCNTTNNSSVTAAQIQSTAQAMVNNNDPAVTTSWTGQYLDSAGNAISGATFSGTSAAAPPSTACGAIITVTGTSNATLSRLAGVNQISSSESAGAIGGGTSGASLAVASLLPYGRHTIYGGAVGNFTVNGSMFDDSVAQCNDRTTACTSYASECAGTPVSDIKCYGDSADVFDQSSETISGTLYSVAPVAIDACLYPAPTSGKAYVMSSSLYPLLYSQQGCGSQWSSAGSPMNYGGIQGNAQPVSDPLASVADPSGNGGAATECPGQSTVSTYNTTTVASGTLSPGVYSNTVVITGSVTLNACQTAGVTTSPGIYVFQKGIEICPTASSTVTGTDVMIYNAAAPAASNSSASSNAVGYCAAGNGSSGSVPDGISIGGPAGAHVSLTGPTSGIYKGIVFFQDRGINLNIGLDDGWLHPSWNTYMPDGATITINGVVYDNSFTNEPSDEVFSSLTQTYAGPYGSLCTGTESGNSTDGPTPCAGIPSSVSLSNTSGTVVINGAVIVGAFATQGGSTSSPMTLTINYDSSAIPSSVGNLRLIF